MATLFRRELGSRFCEGTRLLWLAIEREGISPAAAAKRMGWSRATASHVLYGDRLPGVVLLSAVEREFGVPYAAWTLPPSEPFTPPAARFDGEDDETTDGDAA